MKVLDDETIRLFYCISKATGGGRLQHSLHYIDIKQELQALMKEYNQLPNIRSVLDSMQNIKKISETEDELQQQKH